MNLTQVIQRCLLILMVAGLVAGCFGRDRRPIYVQSEEVPPIQVPAGLSLPDVRQTFDIPGTFLPELAAVGDESKPPVVLSSAEAEASRSHIRFGPTGLYLEVEDEPDSVWRRLSFTLNRGGMNVREINQEHRRYRFYLDHEPLEIRRTGLARFAFWRGDELVDYSGTYLAELREDGNRTRIVLLGEGGEIIEMERAEYVLSMLRERLG